MAEVTVGDGALQITLTVPERVFSLHGASVVVPLDRIRSVRVVRDVLGHGSLQVSAGQWRCGVSLPARRRSEIAQ